MPRFSQRIRPGCDVAQALAPDRLTQHGPNARQVSSSKASIFAIASSSTLRLAVDPPPALALTAGEC
jgi:hypothetical protein